MSNVIVENSAVTIDYTLTDDQGNVIDSSAGQEPLAYLHGHGNIVPGLENALTGKSVGDHFKVDVSPEEGYGVREDAKLQWVPRKQLPKNFQPEVGAQLWATSEQGHQFPVWVAAVNLDAVQMDANHPLAGKTLHFEIRVVGVRDATSEELAHGHIHGEGGHHH